MAPMPTIRRGLGAPRRILISLLNRNEFYLGLAIGAVVLCIAAGIYLGSRVAVQIDIKSSAESDKVPWNLAQSEVELMSLQFALADAILAPKSDLEEVRLRFDIFFSRIAILTQSPLHLPLRRGEDASAALDEVRAFLDRSAPKIDAPDPELRASLPEVLGWAKDLRPAIRTIALRGIQLSSSVADTQRASFVRTLQHLAFITMLLVVSLLLAVAFLTRLSKLNTLRARIARMTNQRIETIMANSLDAVVVADSDGKITEFNEAAEDIFGFTREEAVGATVSDLLIPPQHREAHARGLRRHAETGERVMVDAGIVQTEALRKDGTIIPVEMSISSLPSHGGDAFVAFMRDITVRLAREAELRHARDRAIAGEKAKEAMLLVMSHEIRTPLNGILGTLQLLEDSDLDEKQARLVDVMRTSGEFLMQHVNDVLDISQIDAGNRTINARPFSMQSLIHEVAANQQGLAQAKRNVIEVCDLLASEAIVESDPKWLRQILLNLLSNANKFTDAGHITITLRDADPSGHYRISVADTGIGIAAENMERIFKDFVTIDQSYERVSGGTGLGLGIASRLTAKLGGTLTVESVLGQGSTFHVTLPLPAPVIAPQEVPVAISPAPPSKMPWRKLDVLMAEDNAINRLILQEMLNREGHAVFEAHDGLEAVEAADKRRYDLIFMDISMPRMNGTTAARTIRDSEGPNRCTPIFALTAHASDVSRFLDAGMAGVLIKPLSRAKLRETLADVLKQQDLAEMDDTDLPPHLDPAHLEEMAEALPSDRLARLMEQFHEEMTQGLSHLAEAGSSQGPEDLARKAHKLAGSAATFGLMRIRTKLLEIEDNASSLTPEAIICALRALDRNWEDASAALKTWRAQQLSP